jgi:hypothetical protein
MKVTFRFNQVPASKNMERVSDVEVLPRKGDYAKLDFKEWSVGRVVFDLSDNRVVCELYEVRA